MARIDTGREERELGDVTLKDVFYVENSGGPFSVVERMGVSGTLPKDDALAALSPFLPQEFS